MRDLALLTILLCACSHSNHGHTQPPPPAATQPFVDLPSPPSWSDCDLAAACLAQAVENDNIEDILDCRFVHGDKAFLDAFLLGCEDITS